MNLDNNIKLLKEALCHWYDNLLKTTQLLIHPFVVVAQFVAANLMVSGFEITCIFAFYLLWFPRWWPTRQIVAPVIGSPKFPRRSRTIKVAVSALKVITVFVTMYSSCVVFALIQNNQNEHLKAIDTLAILGTILAIVAWRESTQQNEEVDEIITSLPTRYVDAFPNHLQDIVKLIGDTKSYFYIFADCVDYGSFSNPMEHANLINAIEQKCRNNEKKRVVKIKIAICGKVQPISRSSEFWDKWQASENNHKKWIALRDSKEFRKRLVLFCRLNPPDPDKPFNPFKCERGDFERMMLDYHAKIECRLHKVVGVTIRQYNYLEHMPGVFFWMRDGAEAIFLLSHTGARTQGMTFFTRDVKITDILDKTWKYTRILNQSRRTLFNEYKENRNEANFLKLFPTERHEIIKDFIKFYDKSAS